MGSQLLSSKVVINEETPQVRPVAGVPTSILGLVGVTERGPIGSTTVITSPAQYQRVYGGYVANGDVAQAVDGFFQNGGKFLYVSRAVHCTTASDPTTKTSAAASATVQTAATAPTSGQAIAANAGPYALAPGQTLVVDVDGGADHTTTFNATPASRTDAAVYPAALADGETLTVSMDGGAVQTATFHTANFVNIGAATALEVAAVLSSQLLGALISVVGGHVVITSATKGTGSGVNVTGGTANAALAYTTGNVAGTGNVVNIAAVTAAEVVAALTAAPTTGATASLIGGKPALTSNTTGAASSILVKGTSTAVAIGFDNATHSGLTGAALNTLSLFGKTDGAYANSLSAVIEAATSGEAARFNLRVVKAGVTIETWPNLTMDNSDARFVQTILNDDANGSPYVNATDLNAATVAPYDRPANGTYALTGGNDGLAGIVDNDFIGGTSLNGRTGLRVFDLVQGMSLLAVPGRATSAVHNAMLSYAEVTRGGSMFAILDPPAATSAEGMVTYVTQTAALKELSEFGAIYWPRIQVLNPSTAVFGNTTNLTVAPSGYIAGVMARNDAAREGGVYDAPAGVEKGVILGCLDFETQDVLDSDKRDLIYPQRINPITTQPGLPRYIDGSYTLKSTGNFPTVSERRGVTYIEQSIKGGLQFARHKNNDESLREQVTRTCTTFLLSEMKHGAFRTKDPKTAFFVDFGEGLNTTAVQFAGKLLGRIGLATQKPAQFVVVSFSQDTRSLAT